ncbi:MAG: M20 family metallo-hydrolase [Spirochaetaceae bacterium]|jgi:succinyl-diaminopimelate desuccinylase|nr:M20 family metallo-hydrolase [Spirochaetaceae bacterium]
MKEIFDFLDQSADTAVELESELTKRPALSPDSGGEGEIDKCLFLESWLRSRGIVNLERHDAPDPRAKEGIRPNLIATIPGKDDDTSRLWIISHLDVVPPGEMRLWDSDPWKLVVKDGRLIGRGVEDNQQGLCSSVLAALALNHAGITPPRTVKLLFAADEETGSTYGIIWLLANRTLFHKGDIVLIPDSGDPQGDTIEIAEKKQLWLKLTTIGRQCHASVPDLGNNAFLAASDLVVKLHNGLSNAFADRDPLFDLDYSTFQPTKKEANVPNINTIPGEDVFHMDCRILPHYSIEAVLAETKRLAEEIEKQYKVTVDVGVVQYHYSVPTPKDAPVVRFLIRAITEVYGISPRCIGIGGGTIAAPLRNAGIDCAVWAKLGDSAHQPNEYAFIDNIIGDAKVMASLMVDKDQLNN